MASNRLSLERHRFCFCFYLNEDYAFAVLPFNFSDDPMKLFGNRWRNSSLNDGKMASASVITAWICIVAPNPSRNITPVYLKGYVGFMYRTLTFLQIPCWHVSYLVSDGSGYSDDRINLTKIHKLTFSHGGKQKLQNLFCLFWGAGKIRPPPAQGGAEDSVTLLLTKNPARSFGGPRCLNSGFFFEWFPQP